MFWTLELASHLEEAPWPATKDELIDYAIRSGAPLERQKTDRVAVMMSGTVIFPATTAHPTTTAITVKNPTR
jgi:hypothetical protein